MNTIVINKSNIKQELEVGDTVFIDKNGPFKVTYLYGGTDLGFRIDSDYERGIICDLEIHGDLFYIEKLIYLNALR